VKIIPLQPVNPLIIAAVSGIISALVWEPYSFTALAFVSFQLLLYISHQTHFSNFYKGMLIYVSFFAFHLIAGWWMYSSTMAGSLLAHLFNSAYMTIVMMLWVFGKQFYSSRMSKTVLLIALWITFEWMHQHWELAWPWFNVGHAFGSVPQWVQWYSFTGTAGGTVWVLLVNCLFFYALQDIISSRLSRGYSNFGLALIIILLPIYVSKRMYNAPDQTYPTVDVLVIQPNIHPKAEKFAGVPVSEQMAKALNIAKAHHTASPQLIVFPETMLVDPIDASNLLNDPSIVQLRDGLKHFAKASIYTGAFTRISYNWPIADKHAVIHDSVPFVLYNSALLLQDDTVQAYHKAKLVPLVEKQPFIKLMLPLRRIIEEQGGFFGTYGTHNETSIMPLNDSAAIVPLICFESAFEGYNLPKFEYRHFSSFIVLITNDGWWSSSGGYLQHLHLARLRAIESGQWIVRCANTGVSAIISPKGELVQKLAYDTEGAMRFAVPLINQPVVFARIHPYPSLFMAAIANLMLLLLLFYKVQRRCKR